MKSYPTLLFFKILILFNATPYHFAQDNSTPISLSVPSGINIELSGEVEMEFVDVEGKGGAGLSLIHI